MILVFESQKSEWGWHAANVQWSQFESNKTIRTTSSVAQLKFLYGSSFSVPQKGKKKSLSGLPYMTQKSSECSQ